MIIVGDILTGKTRVEKNINTENAKKIKYTRQNLVKNDISPTGYRSQQPTRADDSHAIDSQKRPNLSEAKSQQTHANQCKSMKFNANQSKSKQIKANQCNSLQVNANPWKSLQNDTNLCKPKQINAI